MMSSICQGLQSYADLHVSSFQLFPPESSFSSRPSLNATEEDDVEEVSNLSDIVRNRDESCSVRRNNGNSENGGGWSFLQAFSHASGIHDDEKEGEVYVHPLVQCSASKLSMKSLEMCTEGLGSESGSDIGEYDISLMSVEGDDSRRGERASNWVTKKANRRDSSFPPPLTSISSSTGVRVESHREDGRLVLRAVATSVSGSSYFHAERGDGRLKLRLVKDYAKRDEEDKEVHGEEEEEEGFSDGDEEGGRWGNDGKDGEENEMGMEKFGRPCRCKEGRCKSTELLNWEAVWVSI